MKETSAVETPVKEKLFDLGYHLRGDLTVEDIDREVEVLKKLVREAGGTVVFEQAPVAHTLAYAISRMEKGKREDFATSYFGTLIFSGEEVALKELNEALSLNRSVLRFLLLKTTPRGTEEVRAIGQKQTAEAPLSGAVEEAEKPVEVASA